MKRFTRDETEHGKEYYLASEVDAAQPEQEPVAWIWLIDGKPKFVSFGGANSNTPKEWTVLPLYTAPPAAQRKPLTDEEIWSAIRPLTKSDKVCKALVNVSVDEYRAIEAAHGIGDNT